MEDLSIVIVNWNGEKFIKDCLASLQRSLEVTQHKVRVIVIDNASQDHSRSIIDQFHQFEKIYLENNVGFAAANNIAFQRYKSRFYLLLNPDTILSDELNINIMMSYVTANPSVGICGCKLNNVDGSWQKSIGHFATLASGVAEQTGLNYIAHKSIVFKYIAAHLSHIFKKNFSHFNAKAHLVSTPIDVDFVWGAYILIKKEVIDEIGHFDETFFIFSEESDLCYRALKNGWKVQYVPFTSIIHLGGQSQKQNITKMYYWHIAVYFWFFAKHFPGKLIFWRIATIMIQSVLFLKAKVNNNRLGCSIHGHLLSLSFIRSQLLQYNIRNKWEMILSEQ